MTSQKSPYLLLIVPSCCGDRLYEDGYRKALIARGITAESTAFSVCDWDKADRFVSYLKSIGVGYVIYPSASSEIFLWRNAETQWLPKRPLVGRESPRTNVGIVEFVALLKAAGIVTVAMDMHFGGPFDFEVTLYGPPDRVINELLEIVPGLAQHCANSHAG